MRVKLLQQDLLPKVTAVSRSVGVRSTLPVLDNILLSAKDGQLTLAATNLEIGVIKRLTAQIEEEGEVTVPAKAFLEIVSGLKQIEVEISSKDAGIEIKAGKFKAKLTGIPASEFPAIPQSLGIGVKFKKDVLAVCSQILYASATDEGRPILTGILTQVTDKKLDFVATDGFRLAHRQVNLNEFDGVDFKNLIPRRTFEEVLRVISEEEVDDVIISTSKEQNQVIFELGTTIISSRLIEGLFPNWEKTIPTNLITRALVEKEEFLKAVKLASVFVKSDGYIRVKSGKEGLSLESSAKELGSQENLVEASIEGEDTEIAFNAKFLLDAITNCPSIQLSLEFSGPLSPALLKPVGVEGLEYIVMPVRLS